MQQQQEQNPGAPAPGAAPVPGPATQPAPMRMPPAPAAPIRNLTQEQRADEQYALVGKIASCFLRTQLDFFEVQKLHESLKASFAESKASGQQSLADTDPELVKRWEGHVEKMLSLSRAQHARIGTVFNVPRTLIEIDRRRPDLLIEAGKREVVGQVFQQIDAIPGHAAGTASLRFGDGQRLESFMTEFRAFSVVQSIVSSWLATAEELETELAPQERRREIIAKQIADAKEKFPNNYADQPIYKSLLLFQAKADKERIEIKERAKLIREIHWRGLLAVPEAVGRRSERIANQLLEKGIDDSGPLPQGGRRALAEILRDPKQVDIADPVVLRLKSAMETSGAIEAGPIADADRVQAVRFLKTAYAELAPYERIIIATSVKTAEQDELARIAVISLARGTEHFPTGPTNDQLQAAFRSIGGENAATSADPAIRGLYAAMLGQFANLRLTPLPPGAPIEEKHTKDVQPLIDDYYALAQEHLTRMRPLQDPSTVPALDPVEVYGEYQQTHLRDLVRSKYATLEDLSAMRAQIEKLEKAYPRHEFSLDLGRLEADLEAIERKLKGK